VFTLINTYRCTIYKIRRRDGTIGGSARRLGKGSNFSRLKPEGFGRRKEEIPERKVPEKEALFALKVINLSLVQVSNYFTNHLLKTIFSSSSVWPSQEDKIEQLQNEVEILKTLDHKNIIKAYETFSFRETKTLEIVMELCTGK
jgi:serine/threonine protein kinase